MTNCEKNFGFTNKSGILMPVSSLPSPYGIGTFGRGAKDFIDFLAACKQKCWQVLPLNPTSYGDSPYQSPASGAGNPYFIDPDILAKKGLLTDGDLADVRYDGDRIDYGWLFYTRYTMLRRAYARFTPDGAFRQYCEANCGWLEDYALFMALKVHYEYRQWTLWSDEHKDIASARAHASEFEPEMGFWRWVQYEFSAEWHAVADYAHKKGIVIIGDMPIYVAHDSVDVWRAPDQFLLDGDYNPTVVAGCPPDAYAEDGQLWGNPIYDWAKMEGEGFGWWIDRVGASFALYDLLRIDHFRGFAGYYTIPAGDENAKNGSWRTAPGAALFDAIREEYPEGKIIAEDLGFITDDVRELLEYTSFPGMKVIQFAFYEEDSEYQPRMYTTDNCIVYTATHDSDCTRTWYEELGAKEKALFRRECRPKAGESPTYAAIRCAMESRANLAVITMPDYLELTSEKGRINVPSVPAGNWTWRIDPAYDTVKLRNKIRKASKTRAAGADGQ